MRVAALYDIDDEIVTRVTPAARVEQIFGEIEADVVVHGHVHVRYDRVVGRLRIVNPGSVGLPCEGRAGAYWATLGPGVHVRRTDYDVAGMIASARELGFPRLDDYVRPSLLEPVDPDVVTAHFERLAVGA